MNLLNHCPDIFPRLNFSIFVSGLLCEFVQHLLLHIFLSQLFNYCLLSTIYFFFQPKLLPPRTVVFIPIESFLMFLAQKLMYFPRPLHRFSFHQSLIRVLDLFFYCKKHNYQDGDDVWDGYGGGWRRLFMGPGFKKDLFCENLMIKIAFEMDMEVGLECLWARPPRHGHAPPQVEERQVGQ